jgi:hypothetical protein
MPQKAFAVVDDAASWLATIGGLERGYVAPLAGAARVIRQRIVSGVPLRAETLNGS